MYSNWALLILKNHIQLQKEKEKFAVVRESPKIRQFLWNCNRVVTAKKWTKKCATCVGAGFSSVLNLYSACNSSLPLFSLWTSFPESLMFTLQDFMTRRRSLYCVGSFRFPLKTRARTTVPVLTWTSWKVGAKGGWKANCAQRKRAGPKRTRFSRLMRKLIREAFNSESPATFFLSR